jgi:hypothetical protein
LQEKIRRLENERALLQQNAANFEKQSAELVGQREQEKLEMKRKERLLQIEAEERLRQKEEQLKKDAEEQKKRLEYDILSQSQKREQQLVIFTSLMLISVRWAASNQKLNCWKKNWTK